MAIDLRRVAVALVVAGLVPLYLFALSPDVDRAA
jgi:hypothetical protein